MSTCTDFKKSALSSARRNILQGGRIAQQVKTLAVRPDELSLSLRTYKVGENQLLQAVF